MTLTEAEQKFGVSCDTLKKYVSFGLIQACKTNPDVCEYRDEDFERLGLIDFLINLGFSPEETKKYLDLTESPDTEEEQIRMLQRQRRSLLDDIHRKQQLLDCLDFIIREKKKS